MFTSRVRALNSLVSWRLIKKLFRSREVISGQLISRATAFQFKDRHDNDNREVIFLRGKLAKRERSCAVRFHNRIARDAESQGARDKNDARRNVTRWEDEEEPLHLLYIRCPVYRPVEDRLRADRNVHFHSRREARCIERRIFGDRSHCHLHSARIDPRPVFK